MTVLQFPRSGKDGPDPTELDRPIDNTAKADFERCHWLYYAGMVRHRRKDDSKSPPLAYGTVWHSILQAHYESDGDMSKVLVAAVAGWQEHGKMDDHRTLERALMEYDNYKERWGAVPSRDEEAKTLGWPDSPMVEISMNATWPGSLHPYAGKIDRILDWNGQIFIEDHKTTSQMGATYFRQFELSNQMMGYAFLGELITGRPVAGVRINAHAIYKRESKFERQVFSYSKERLADWAENNNAAIAEIKECYRTGLWRRNFNGCAGKYGMCSYADVCSVAPSIREAALEQDFPVNPWNPLEAADGDTAAAD